MNGIIAEILEQNEINITDINHLVYAAATVITEGITTPGKMVKNRRTKATGEKNYPY
jgi:hypothetical protein